jgi:hypothetical protein
MSWTRTLTRLISRRSNARNLRAAWDSLSAELIRDPNRHGVRGTSYRLEPLRLIVYSDDPPRSVAMLPANWHGIPVSLVPSDDYPAP